MCITFPRYILNLIFRDITLHISIVSLLFPLVYPHKVIHIELIKLIIVVEMQNFIIAIHLHDIGTPSLLFTNVSMYTTCIMK